MKKLAKLLAFVLALAMVLSLGVGLALAADDDIGTITIRNPEADSSGQQWNWSAYSSYSIYRLLDLTGQDTTEDGTLDVVSYTIAPKWAGFFTEGEGADYLIPAADATAAQKESLNQIVYNGAAYYLNVTESNVADFANAATRCVMDGSVTADGGRGSGTSGADITFTGLPLGYYLVVPFEMWSTIGAQPTENSTGSIASLTSTVPDAEVVVKGVRPPLEKTDDAISADVGQVVHYSLTSKVPNAAGYSEFYYKFMDLMSTGLTFNNDVHVTVTHGGEEIDITEDCTIEPADANTIYGYYKMDKAFSVLVPVGNYQGLAGANGGPDQPNYIGDTITVSYSATVNFNAVVDQIMTNPWQTSERHERNQAQLRYGHDPDDLAYTQFVSEEVYTSSIYIHKYTANAASDDIPLEGAAFVLMNSEGKYLKYDRQPDLSDPQNPVYPTKAEWVTVTGAPTDGTAGVTNAQLKALSDAAKAGTILSVKTGPDGLAAFFGLKDGDYYLVEIESPAGYNGLDKPQKVTLQGTDADTAAGKAENVADGLFPFSMDSSSDSYANVLNQTGSVLPTTGGMGTQLFYILGGVLVLAAGVVLVSRRRMKAE